jgi:hypothetical protein
MIGHTARKYLSSNNDPCPDVGTVGRDRYSVNDIRFVGTERHNAMT